MSNLTQIKSSKFFHFNQNNSGGLFSFDLATGITHHVIVEAHDFTHANILAAGIGLYFDGLGDCNCCGNRWSEKWDDDIGSNTPTIYNHPVDRLTGISWMAPGKESVVHYLDGRKEWFGILVKNKGK